MGSVLTMLWFYSTYVNTHICSLTAMFWSESHAYLNIYISAVHCHALDFHTYIYLQLSFPLNHIYIYIYVNAFCPSFLLTCIAGYPLPAYVSLWLYVYTYINAHWYAPVTACTCLCMHICAASLLIYFCPSHMRLYMYLCVNWYAFLPICIFISTCVYWCLCFYDVPSAHVQLYSLLCSLFPFVYAYIRKVCSLTCLHLNIYVLTCIYIPTSVP